MKKREGKEREGKEKESEPLLWVRGWGERGRECHISSSHSVHNREPWACGVYVLRVISSLTLLMRTSSSVKVPNFVLISRCENAKHPHRSKCEDLKESGILKTRKKENDG
jgi:hypothetical protein